MPQPSPSEGVFPSLLSIRSPWPSQHWRRQSQRMDTCGQGTRRKAGAKGLNGLEWGGAMEEGADVESQNTRPTQ